MVTKERRETVVVLANKEVVAHLVHLVLLVHLDLKDLKDRGVNL